MSLAAVVLLPLAGALLPSVTVRAGRTAAMLTAAATTLLALAVLLAEGRHLLAGEVVVWRMAWMPRLGLDLDLRLDPLAFMMAALILGIGLLIVIYARAYLAKNDPLGRLLGLLLLFQASMLGIALSDNVLLLVVFWELTSLSSFLLIGYWQDRDDARAGAWMALSITGAGGLCLLAGLLLLAEAAGAHDIGTIVQRPAEIAASPLATPALLLILLGAFTKSAQWPFHIWLPRAMAAPTPVSAYLHSATMVKAGVFLLARLWPALSPLDLWTVIVVPVGLATMLLGAWWALRSDDLKALLAWSTVSQLGLMTMLLGFGTPFAATAAMLHLLNHCAFKAALFMAAGIVEHETGLRDLRRLSGLAHGMPITATIALAAAAAMAGLPLTNGWVSKEMMLDAAVSDAPMPWVVGLLATVAALLSVAYAARFGLRVFTGPRHPSLERLSHDPGSRMWVPPALLIVPILVVGFAPGIVEPFVHAVAAAVTGMPVNGPHLAVWHGLTPAFLLSLTAIGGGAVLYARASVVERLARWMPRIEGERIFVGVVAALVGGSRLLVRTLHNGSLQRYLACLIVVMVAVGIAAFASAPSAPGMRPWLTPTPAAIAGWLVLTAACALVLRVHRNRLAGVLATGVAGLVVSLAFLHLSAPDLALTQISVEVVTTILLLLALNYLPKTTPSESSPSRRVRDAALAVLVGGGLGGLLYLVMTREPSTIADYYLETAKPLGGGANVVNVILVDYRGYDTFGEIIVLGIAALAIVALLDGVLRGVSAKRLAAWPVPAQAAEAHPLLLVLATRLLLPFALTVAVHILLRGHNAPGGGFIAGLVVAIALVLQYLASGFGWAARRLPGDQHLLIGWGVLIAGLTGMGAWAAGHPFLTSAHSHLHLPLLGDVELATAMLFDLGVFSTVLGVVMLSLAGLARIGRRAASAVTTVADESGMDVPPRLIAGRLLIAADLGTDDRTAAENRFIANRRRHLAKDRA